MNDLEMARIVFQSNSYAFVLVRDHQVLATGTRQGVGELLDAVAHHGELVRGAALADKIVGKAVAMVAAYAGITAIYSPLASQAGEQVCQQYNIEFHADHLVPLIRNKRNDGPCPMERLTLELDEPADAVLALRAFVAARHAPTSTPTH